MAKKRKKHNRLTIDNSTLQATIEKWKAERAHRQENINLKRNNKVIKSIEINNSVPVRTSVKTIMHVLTKDDVDAALECFIWPTPRYNRDDDFYIQKLIGENEQLMSYFHLKMKNYFGLVHVLKKDVKSRTTGNMFIEHNKPVIRRHITINKSNNDEQKNSSQFPEIKKDNKASTLKIKTWTLDWDFVEFHEEFYVIYSPNRNYYDFEPRIINNKKSQTSFNYIRKYLKEKLSPIFCSILNRQLIINSPILLEEAIGNVAKIARQKGISIVSKEAKKTQSLSTISFEKALSKAGKMTVEEFQKYKSDYINYLLEKQKSNYKIIPCVERLAHINSKVTEQSFLFSMECKSGNILIVHENVNPDRSTLLFLVKTKSYEKAIRNIYNFLQSSTINKRSGIRNRAVLINDDSIINYNSINHDDLQSWKSTVLRILNNTMAEKMVCNYLKVTYNSLSSLLRNTQTKQGFIFAKPVFENLSLPIDRKVKPADILRIIPEKKIIIGKDGKKTLPIHEGEWSLENLIKLLDN